MSLARSILLGMTADTLFPLVATAPRDRCERRREPRRRPGRVPASERLRWEGGVRVLTTTDLTPADIGELSVAARSGPVEVRLAIPTPDRRLSSALEPGAPPPSLRFAALRAARRAGLAAGVVVAPLIPGVNDTEFDLVRLLDEARAAGAAFVGFRVACPSERRSRELVQSLRARCPRAAARYEVRRIMSDRQPTDDPGTTEAPGARESLARMLRRLAPRCGLPLRNDPAAEAPNPRGLQTEFRFAP